MHVNLSPEMEGYIRSKVDSGTYSNATAMIRDAVRRMQAEDGRLSAWQAAINQGEEELGRGEGIAYTPETLREVTASVLSAMRSGEPAGPDVSA